MISTQTLKARANMYNQVLQTYQPRCLAKRVQTFSNKLKFCQIFLEKKTKKNAKLKIKKQHIFFAFIINKNEICQNIW